MMLQPKLHTLCFTMQLGYIYSFIHPRVYETSRVHGFCSSCFSFEVWLHHSTNTIIRTQASSPSSPSPLFLCTHMTFIYRIIWQGIKFGGLTVGLCNRQIKICHNFLLAYILYVWWSCTEPPHLNPPIFLQWWFWATVKFNSHQYFWLYGKWK